MTNRKRKTDTPPQQRDAVAILWFLREAGWREIAVMTWRIKRMKMNEFVSRLRQIGVTPSRSANGLVRKELKR